MVFIEVRSMTENTGWEGLDRIFRKMFKCGLKEGIQARRFHWGDRGWRALPMGSECFEL
jgi:hypothetical protein